MTNGFGGKGGKRRLLFLKVWLVLGGIESERTIIVQIVNG